jgi:hypothetical protein
MDIVERGKMLAIIEAMRYRSDCPATLWDELVRRVRGLERKEEFSLFGYHEDVIPYAFWLYLVRSGKMDLQLLLNIEAERFTWKADED